MKLLTVHGNYIYEATKQIYSLLSVEKLLNIYENASVITSLVFLLVGK